jgi:hypothetical protein
MAWFPLEGDFQATPGVVPIRDGKLNSTESLAYNPGWMHQNRSWGIEIRSRKEWVPTPLAPSRSG